MSSGERPIGAAKGKQSDTEALCQPPPPPISTHLTVSPHPQRNIAKVLVSPAPWGNTTDL